MCRIIIGIVKNSGVVLLGVVLLLLAVGGSNPLQAAEPIRIGAVLAVTGMMSQFGTPNKEAITIGMERVNREGGVFGRKVEVYFEDDQSTPTNTTIAATKLIRDKKVCCVIGSSVTFLSMPMLPIFEREEVMNVSLGAGYEITNPVKKWVFSIPPGDLKLSPMMVKYAVTRLNAKKLALLHSTDASGVMGAKGVIENAPKLGASIIITEKFDPTDTNMVPQLTRIKAASPDAIILYTTAGPAAVVAKNYHQLGLKIQVIASHAVLTTEFAKIAGKYAEEAGWILFAGRALFPHKISPDDPYRKDIFDPLAKTLKERYGKEFQTMNGIGNDSFQAVVRALKIAGTDNRAALRDAMEKVSFAGISDNYKYSPTDHNGVDVKVGVFPDVMGGGLFPLMIKGGQITPIE